MEEPHRPNLREHQQFAVDNLANGKVVWGGVGSGKTRVSFAYYMEKEAPRDIYVITTAKKRDDGDWLQEASEWLIGTRRDSTVAGCLTVDSWHRIGNYRDVQDAFFIFDEQRVVGSGAWARDFIRIAKNNQWILLTATPGDDWIEYAPLFIANGLYKNITQFKREHVIYDPYAKFPKIKGYIGTDTLQKYKNMLLVEVPYDRHTTRHIKNLVVDYDEELVRKITEERWNPFEERPCKDISEVFRLVRQVTNGHPSRFEGLLNLLENDHPRMIIYYNFNFERDILRGLNEYVECAEYNGSTKQNVPRSERWAYLVQYQAASEGWNCIETDAMGFYSLSYSYKMTEQSMGRIDRMDTPFDDLNYRFLVSRSWIDRAIMRSLARKETFNEGRFAKESGLLAGTMASRK